jgi:hypothetical protein
MAGKVLPSIETDGDPSSVNGSVLSDGSYVEEGTPEPDDPEARLSWGRKHYGESWYTEEVAGREAARNARRVKEERERIKEEEVEAIRRLRETDPLEYERQMTEYNLRLQGLTQEQIDKSNQPLPDKVVKSNWEGFSARLQGKVLAPTKEASRKIRRGRIAKSTARNRSVGSGNQSNPPAPTLAGALVDEESASNATNVKVPRSKHDKTRQRKAYKGERTSLRLAGEPPQFGIFAKPSVARPVPESLQRNPSTRKRNPGPRSKKKSIAVEPAEHRGALKSGREGTHRSRSKRQSGG